MPKTKGLGRGLDALLNSATNVSTDAQFLTVPIDSLHAGHYQPRSQMDDATLQTLAESIKARGILQPILVHPDEAGGYQIIAGERRWRASQLAGLRTVPVLVRELAAESILVTALIENIQREDLNPIEEAQGIKRLLEEFKMTHEEIASELGRSRAAVSNLLRLLSLDAGVQDLLKQKKLDMGHARALLGLPKEVQLKVAEDIMRRGLSVRGVEELVKKLQGAVNSEHSPENISGDVLRLQNNLSEVLGAHVSIVARASGAGVLKINYANLNALQGIVERILH
ncbi:MAG: ParB/RepB/Spo0J family partition protein [Methylophilaceae bacterium]|nr:ParB/RepB/Spo0J family partition protein [Methylophilaceae bacterium]